MTPETTGPGASPMDDKQRVKTDVDGKDFNIGRRIARMLRDAGGDDIRVRATARVTDVGDYYQTFS